MCWPVSLIATRSSCGGGVEAAALGAAAVVDRPAAENLGKPLQRHVVARIDEAVALRRARDVAAVERRDRQPGERPLTTSCAQARLADILVQHPEEMADARAAAVVQALLREPRIDRLGELGIVDEGGMGIEQIERAGVADRHQRQRLALGEREDAHVERVEAERDRWRAARARRCRSPNSSCSELEAEPAATRWVASLSSAQVERAEQPG